MSQPIVIFLLFAVVQVVSALAALLFSNIDKLGSGAPLESLTTQPVVMGICMLIGELILGGGLWYYFRTEAHYRRLVATNAQRKKAAEVKNTDAQAAEAPSDAQATEAPSDAQATEIPKTDAQAAVSPTSAPAPDPSLRGDFIFPTIKRHLPERPISWQRAVLYVAATIVVALLLGEALSWVGVDDSTESALFKGMMTSPWCVILLCLVGPWAEEMTFRKGIVRGLYRRGLPGWAAALISAFAFAVVHGNLVQGIPALIIGFLFGLLYLRTGNLKLCLTAHVINNAIAAILIIIK